MKIMYCDANSEFAKSNILINVKFCPKVSFGTNLYNLWPTSYALACACLAFSHSHAQNTTQTWYLHVKRDV